MDQVKDWSLGSELLEKIEQRGDIHDNVRNDEDRAELNVDKGALDSVLVNLEKPKWSLLIKSLLKEYKNLSLDAAANTENEQKESDGKTQNRVASTSFMNRLIHINLETEEEEVEEQPKNNSMQVDEIPTNPSDTAQNITSSDMETEKTPSTDSTLKPAEELHNITDKSTDENGKESTVAIVEEKADVEMTEVSNQPSLKRKREEEENEGESRTENDGNNSENGEESENDEDEAEEKRLSLR